MKLVIYLYILFIGLSDCVAQNKMPFSINEVEKGALVKMAESGDILSIFKLAEYYRYGEFDEIETMNWYKKASNYGSIVGMISYGSIVREHNYDSEYTDVLTFLEMTSAIGIRSGKELYIDICSFINTCSLSPFYSLIELVLEEPDVYISSLLCYISNKKDRFTNIENTLLRSIYKVYKPYFGPKELCYDGFYSKINTQHLYVPIQENLFNSLTEWLNHKKLNGYISTQEQEKFLYENELNRSK